MKGLVFPLDITDGGLYLSDGLPVMKSNLLNLLTWKTNTRDYLLDYGSRFTELLEDPADDTTIALFRFFTIECIATWEPRVKLLKQTFIISSDNVSKSIYQQLTYIDITTKQLDNSTGVSLT